MRFRRFDTIHAHRLAQQWIASVRAPFFVARDGGEYIASRIRVFENFRVHDPVRLVSGEDGFHARRARMIPVEAGQDQSANVALREVVIEAFLNLLRRNVVALRHVRVNNDCLVSGPNRGQRPLPYVKREDVHHTPLSSGKIDLMHFPVLPVKRTIAASLGRDQCRTGRGKLDVGDLFGQRLKGGGRFAQDSRYT